MTLHDVALDDKFDLGKERVFLSGAQAVVRMLLMQREHLHNIEHRCVGGGRIKLLVIEPDGYLCHAAYL